MSGTEITALLLLCTAVSFTPGPNTTLSTALASNLCYALVATALWMATV